MKELPPFELKPIVILCLEYIRYLNWEREHAGQ